MKVLSKLGIAIRVAFVMMLAFLMMSIGGVVQVDVGRGLVLGSWLISRLLDFL